MPALSRTAPVGGAPFAASARAPPRQGHHGKAGGLRGSASGRDGDVKWQNLYDLDAIDALKHEELVARKDNASRLDLQRGLHLQTLEAGEKREAALAEERRYGDYVKSLSAQYEAEDLERLRSKMQKQIAFNASCDKILAAKQRRLKREAQADTDLDKKVTAMAAEAGKRQAAAVEEAKRKKQETIAALEEDRQLFFKNRAARARQERLDDQRMMKEQEEVSDKREAERARYYENIQSLVKRERGHHPSVVRKTLQQLENEDLVRCTLQDKEIHAKELKRAADRHSMLKQHAEETTDAFHSYHYKAVQRDEQLREESLKDAEQLRSMAAAAQAKDEEKQRLKEQNVRQSFNTLRLQMTEQKPVAGKFGYKDMSIIEQTFNAERLKRASSEGMLESMAPTRGSAAERAASGSAPKSWGPHAVSLGRNTATAAVHLLDASRSSWRHPSSLPVKQRPVEPEPQLPPRRGRAG